MRETLFLRLREPRADASVDYAIAAADAAAGLTVRHGTLVDVGAVSAGRRVIVFVPTMDVRLLKVTVPARQASKVLQAAPYLIEDQFADDVETLHFALGPRQPDSSYPIAAIGRERFRAWLKLLQDHRIQPSAIVSEVQALPWPGDNSWYALAEKDQVTVRTAAFGGFSATPEDLEWTLKLADPSDPPQPLRILMTQDVATDYTRLARPVELRPGYNNPIEVLARNFRAGQAIDLLQSEYAVRDNWQRYLQPWRLAGALAAGLFFCAVAINAADAFRANRAAHAQEQANLQRFQMLFPSETANESLLADQVSGLLKHGQGRDANGLFFLIQRFEEAQNAAPGLTLKSLQYRDGALFLNLTGSDVQVVEKVRAWFSQHPGARIEVVNEDSSANGVQIRLKLSLA